MEKGDTEKLTAMTFGYNSGAVTVSVSNPEVVSVSEDSNEKGIHTFTLNALAYGTADITVSADGISATCKVTVAKASGIQSATGNANGMMIMPGDGCIKAEGATSISVYAANGSNVAKANGQAVATSQIGKGVFIVVATDANGNRQTAKVVIK